MGHSLGGNLSQEAVRREPGRFAGLVVVDSTWNTGPLTRTATSMPRWATAEGVNEHVIAGAGHIATQDAPQAVTGTLLSFPETVGAAP